MYVDQLHCWLWCCVMPQCPRLLSLGLVCSRDGFAFTWCPLAMAPSLSMPVKSEPDPRRAVTLIVTGNCPMLPDFIYQSCFIDAEEVQDEIRLLQLLANGVRPGEEALGSTECFPVGGSGPDGAPPVPLVPPEHTVVLDQRLLAGTREHLLSHFPKNPWCPACQRATARRQQRRDRGGHAFRGQPFGRRATCDHVVVSPEAIVGKVVACGAKGLPGGEIRYCVKRPWGLGLFGLYPMSQRDIAHSERAVVGCFWWR